LESPHSLPKAVTVLRKFHDSACMPVLVECDDGELYVLKGSQTGRSAFNDNVVGRVAQSLGMPVPRVTLVHVPQELVALNPDEIGHFSPGVAHASHFVADCAEGWFKHIELPENRARYALLAFLYGWMDAAEKQFFYRIYKPKLVYSFDHDAFFPNGPNWNAVSLDKSLMTYPDFDDTIVRQASINPTECEQVLERIQHLRRPMIQDAIDATPLELGPVNPEERGQLCDYLWNRAAQMLSVEK
jgi:hypothetical protein